MKIHQKCTNEWKVWFAWYPVELQNWEIVWLETVYRKWFHENRIPNLSPSSWIIYKK